MNIDSLVNQLFNSKTEDTPVTKSELLAHDATVKADALQRLMIAEARNSDVSSATERYQVKFPNATKDDPGLLMAIEFDRIYLESLARPVPTIRRTTGPVTW